MTQEQLLFVNWDQVEGKLGRKCLMKWEPKQKYKHFILFVHKHEKDLYELVNTLGYTLFSFAPDNYDWQELDDYYHDFPEWPF